MLASYYCNCVDWPEDEVEDLDNLTANWEPISRRSFVLHVNSTELKDLEKQLGYGRSGKLGFSMASDWHVSYFKGELRRKEAYVFCHSGIEYVFVCGEMKRDNIFDMDDGDFDTTNEDTNSDDWDSPDSHDIDRIGEV